jgi:hypothetical protein
MPIVLRILGEKTVSGDMDLTRTYIGVWCDNYGQGIVEIDDEQAYAEAAGLRGTRGVRSWRERMRKLAELGFLRLHEGGAKSVAFVAILHPYDAVEDLRTRGLVSDAWWGAYQQRLAQVGALVMVDLDPGATVARVDRLPSPITLHPMSSQTFTVQPGVPPSDKLVVEVFDANLRGQAQAGTPISTIVRWPVAAGARVRLLVRNRDVVPLDYQAVFS